jgi:hypothetical protein
VKNAPAKVVEAERKKQADTLAKLHVLKEQMNTIRR